MVPYEGKVGIEFTGAVLSFDLNTGDADPKETAWKFIDSLKLHSNLANVGDVRSLVHSPSNHHPLAIHRGKPA